jgi:hypothetical protein
VAYMLILLSNFALMSLAVFEFTRQPNLKIANNAFLLP